MKKLFTLFAFISLISLSPAFSQGTFSTINSTIFQASCTAGCHNSTTLAGNLDLSGTDSMVYANLAGVTPSNTQAQALNLKRISAGYPEKSFLMCKVQNNLDSALLLSFLGADATHNFLTKPQAELIRQWILFGAHDTGTVINPQVLIDYYSGMGIPRFQRPPSPSEEGVEGFQLHIGPVFLAPNQEVEYFKKTPTYMPVAKEVFKTKGQINYLSHHLVLMNMDTGYAATYAEGYISAFNIFAQAGVHLHSKQVAIWQFSREDVLPAGTAYYWTPGTVLIQDYHVLNHNQDSVMAADGYINVYTRATGSGADTMHSSLAVYGGQNPFILHIPNTGLPVTKSFALTDPGKTYNFWILQAHTHKLGTGFNMFLRNADGTKGQQVYNGDYNVDYTFQQGYYDYSHPAVETFADSLLTVDMNKGLIFEATWVNSTADTVNFGFTTQNEMFIAYIQHTVGTHTSHTGIDNKNEPGTGVYVYPNPVSDVLNISFDAPEKAMPVVLEIQDVLGNKVFSMNDKMSANTAFKKTLNMKELRLAGGLYLLKITEGENSFTKKLLVD